MPTGSGPRPLPGDPREVVALRVHGADGVVDLVVPALATAEDVAQEYADQLGLLAPPTLGTTTGAPLPAGRTLAEAGVRTGALLVAVTSGPAGGTAGSTATASDDGPGSTGPWAVTLLLVAGAAALLAAWSAAGAGGAGRDATAALLALGALVGVLPVGRLATARSVLAPVYAGAAAYTVVWDPAPERLPTVVGVSALVAAVAAGVARALSPRSDEVLRVWVALGSGVFVVTTGGALVGAPSQLVWGVLLLLAMLAPRFVPSFAVDVPDQLLVDLERLAVNAWSARDRPSGRRGRTVVPQAGVAALAARGARTVTAAAAAVLAVVVVAAPSLLDVVEEGADVVGARLLVLLAGAAVLLAARAYRHRVARALLRLAGLWCWVVLLWDLAGALREGAGVAVGAAAVAVGVLVVVAAVATGRGWRSAWWSRRADVLEGLAGAAALACLVPASGLFRQLWENVPDV